MLHLWGPHLTRFGISSLDYETPGSGKDEDPALLEGSDDEETIPSAQVPPVSSSADQERDIYDSKLLDPIPPGPRKQLIPVLPVCAKHMHHYWKDPLDLKGTVHPKMKILSSFTQPQVDPNLYECL